MSDEESLLTNLCAICHIQPPKYRCPRCLTRTCSLPCTRRHKLWSQCSGLRDPGAYLRRNELATESAFDRDFNFITGIERRIERAGREAEDRGVNVDGRHGVRDPGVVGLEHESGLGDQDEAGMKRKRKQNLPGPNVSERGLPKGESGFLRRAQEAGVKVITAPRGMSRAKMNGSKWHAKQKCLQWTVEWVTDDGTKRMHSTETCTVAEAYDRAFPLTKEEKQIRSQEAAQQTEKGTGSTQPESGVSDTVPESESMTTDTASNQPTNAQQGTPSESTEETIGPHRNVFFYLHRPRTATKQQVLSPVVPDTTLTNALRDRIVLEFPTIYVLRSPLNDEQPQDSKFILDKEYLQTHGNPEADDEASEDIDPQPLLGAMDIPDVDEGKMLEVLNKDLLYTVPAAGGS